MAFVLHGSCCSLPHGHSHGTKSCPSGNHSHSNGHTHNGHIPNGHDSTLLSPEMNGRNSTSFYNHNSPSRTHSRHNSFTNKLGNKTQDDHRHSVDILRTRIDDPIVHRMSIDGGLTRYDIRCICFIICV